MSKPKSKTVAWKSLKHAQGAATRVPAQVEQLSSDNAMARDDAYSLLRASLVGRDEWFGASAPAAALLLDGALESAKEPHRVLLLVADIIGGDHGRAWATEAIAEQAAGVRAEVIERRGLVESRLRHESPAVRAAAAVVLALLAEIRREVSPQLLRLAREDASAAVRATAILSLAACGDDAAVKDARKSGDAIVRGAAAIAALRLDPRSPFEAERAGLQDWLTWVPSQDLGSRVAGEPPSADEQVAWFATYLRWPWYRGLPFPDATAKALTAVATARGEAGRAAALDLLLPMAERAEKPPLAVQVTKIALGLGGFENVGNVSDDRVLAPEDLGEPRRATAARLARTWLLPGGGFGLPVAGQTRRRWLGLEAPGPLEQLVEIKAEGKARQWPVWRAFYALHREFDAPFPQPLDEGLSGLDRWEALVVLYASSYGFRVIGDKTLAEELGRVPAGKDLEKRAAALAGDMAERCVASDRMGIPLHRRGASSALLLLPLIRNGIPVDPRWDVLVAVENGPFAIEVLGALPEERRVAIFRRYSETTDPTQITQSATTLLQLLPTCPTRAAAQVLVELAEKMKDLRPDWTKYIVDGIHELAKTHPGLSLS